MAALRVLQASKHSNVSKIVSRSCSTLAPTAPLPLPPAEQEFRDKFLSRIGNRDIVGFGRNGTYNYMDDIMFPYPAIRWEQNTAASEALVQKARGDWKNLSLEEKKSLYRHSFCQTFAEMKAPTSEWKIVWTIVLLTLTASCWVYVFMRNNVFDAMLPKTITREHVTATTAKMIKQRQGIVHGVGSKYDYENQRWKD